MSLKTKLNITAIASMMGARKGGKQPLNLKMSLASPCRNQTIRLISGHRGA